MAIELITGYAGSGHISSADAGRFNAGVCGTGRYVLGTGTKFAYETISSNLVRISSGDAVDQGRHIIIPQNSTEDAAIENGSQNKTRIDVIALRYSRNTSTGVESASLEVIKGTEVNIGSTPAVPSTTNGNIFNGATEDDFPLYHVLIEGTQIKSVTKVFEEIPSLSAITDAAHPVGSIYIRNDDVNPGILFGGEWVEVQGKLLLGRSANHEIGSSGGNETITLTTNQMPAHTHTGPSHTHTGPSHTHTVAAHTHTATCASAGAHQHVFKRSKTSASGNKRFSGEGTANSEKKVDSAGAHTHTITIASGGGGNTGAAGTGNTGAAGTGNTGSAGGGQAINIMNPYYTVCIWIRVA